MNPQPSPPIDNIAEAFSRTADRYDGFTQDHPNLSRMRHKVYDHLLRHLPGGVRVLELNAGTGIDAVHLAQQGFRVHATEIAPGMLANLQAKVASLDLADSICFQACSFTALDQVQGGPYEAVFSNLGGLNCLADLRIVTGQLPGILSPGGTVTWVLMPPVCLWELAMAFTGEFKYAFRRLSREGTIAHLEGQYFPVYYFTPRQVMAAFGPEFSLVDLEGLSVFAPPADRRNLTRRHPKLYRWLCWLDDRLSSLPPWRSWGDFFILTMRYEPSVNG